jgi:LuxR family maltose regulon positive regulatory protein
LRAFGLAKERIGQHSDPAALPASLLATIYYEWDRIEEARKYLDLSLPLIDECAALDAVIHGYRTLARMQYLENAPSDALDTLAVAEAIGDRGNFPRLTVSILGQRVHFLIRMGDVESASNVVEEMLGLAARAERRRVDLWPRLHSVADMAKARLLIATGAPEKGLRLLRDYAAMAEAAGRGQALVEIRLLEALADFQLGNNGAAIRRLSRALSEGRKGALIRTFVDEGGELARLFRAALAEWSGSRIGGAARPDPEYLGQLGAAMEVGTEAVAPAGTHCAGIDLDRLSGRETDVLRLVAEGTTNKGIAAELGVAESTVAWHLKNIYGKLEVNNRTAALAVARRHAFIP